MDLAFIHDLLVTEHYYVLLLGPIKFDVNKFVTQYLLSRCSIAECLVYNEDGPSRVMLVPRPGRPGGAPVLPQQPRFFDAPPFFSFHHVNAYDTEAGQRLVIDTIAWDEVRGVRSWLAVRMSCIHR